MLPHFIIVGAAKSGTSTLTHYLQKHRAIYMPSQEVHFFHGGRNGNWDKGVNWYKMKFEDAKRGQLIGEKTPTYSYLPSVPKRIHDLLPNVKLIWIFRNPIDRSYSNYWHEVWKGNEWMDFNKAIKKEHRRHKKDVWKGYATRSLYIDQVRRYLQYFDLNQMFFIKFEELKCRPGNTVENIFSFLNVEAQDVELLTGEKKNLTYIPRSIILQYLSARTLPERLRAIFVNRMNRQSRPGYPPMDAEVNDYLRGIFKKPNKDLEILTGIDVSDWN